MFVHFRVQHMGLPNSGDPRLGGAVCVLRTVRCAYSGGYHRHMGTWPLALKYFS